MIAIAALLGAIVGFTAYFALKRSLPRTAFGDGIARWLGMTIYFIALGWGLENDNGGLSRARTGNWVRYERGETLPLAPILGLAFALFLMVIRPPKGPSTADAPPPPNTDDGPDDVADLISAQTERSADPVERDVSEGAHAPEDEGSGILLERHTGDSFSAVGVFVTLDDALVVIRADCDWAAKHNARTGADTRTLALRRGVEDYMEISVSTDGSITLDVELPVRSGWWIFMKPFSVHLALHSRRELESWVQRFFSNKPADLAAALRNAGAA